MKPNIVFMKNRPAADPAEEKSPCSSLFMKTTGSFKLAITL